MTDDPFEPANLAEIADLPPDDPRRRALERTAHGRAMLAAYRSFLNPGEAPPGARTDEAEAKLGERLAAEIGLGSRERERESEGTSPVGGWARIARMFGAPSLRPAYALAVMVIFAGGVWLAIPRHGEHLSPMRGTVIGDSGETAGGLVVHDPSARQDGGLELSWEPVLGADHYDVRFFHTDLTALGAPIRTDAPRLDLGHDALPQGLLRGTTVLWQVTARRGADALASSRTRSLRLP
jgi:hypothetical protein